ncbi:hypothetical protein BKA83DRAFT_88020 [Pisolithus microcarpus]|nr:hypothetical protein BKA83DRAFT_88020 [Pisolithus microcarpus]
MPVQTRSGGRRSTSTPHTKTRISPRRGKKKRASTAELKEHAEEEQQVGDKREAEQVVEFGDEKQETETGEVQGKKARTDEDEAKRYSFHEGTIERGHVYFFYRPKVQYEEVHNIDDVRNFHMLLIPRPPEFSVHIEGQQPSWSGKGTVIPDDEMSRADVVPASPPKDQPKTHFRLITVGKKRLPDPDAPGGKGVYWASGRGVYAIVNTRGKTVSRNATHFGYHLSHPSEGGEVQLELGIHTASSFVLQVKNPEAEPGSFGQRIGLPAGRRAKYPEGILKYVFERETRGRSYGLAFRAIFESSWGERITGASRRIYSGNFAIEKDRFPAEPIEGKWI